MSKLLVCTFILSVGFSGLAYSQTPLERIQADVEVLKEQAKASQKFQADVQRGIAEILSKQVSLEIKPDKDTAQAKVSDAEKRGLPKTLEQLATDTKRFNALEPSVDSLIRNCVAAVSKAKVVPNNYNFSLEGCSQRNLDELKDALLKQESDAVASYEQCRSVINTRAAEYKSLLPANINDLDLKRISDLGNYPDPDVKECAQEISKAIQQVAQAKDAKAVISTALAMAANICFASGGNPYICGAMLFVAVLMDIFDGSGSGRGDGGGADKDRATGTGGSPTVSNGPGRESKQQREAREKTAEHAIAKGPSENLATPGGDPDLSCQGVPTGQIRCRLLSKSGSERFFSGDPLLTRVARNPGPGLVVVCKGDSTIKGIAVLDRETNTYSVFGYTRATQERIANVRTKEEACGKIP